MKYQFQSDATHLMQMSIVVTVSFSSWIVKTVKLPIFKKDASVNILQTLKETLPGFEASKYKSVYWNWHALAPTHQSQQYSLYTQHLLSCFHTLSFSNYKFMSVTPMCAGIAQHSNLLWARLSRNWILVGTKFSTPVQIGPGTNSASCKVGTGSLSGYSERGMVLIYNPIKHYG